LWTTLHVARAFVPAMLADGWGRMLVVSTPLAQAPGAKQAPYAIGKAAQEILMMALAQELKGTGVTANCIQIRSVETAPPGPTLTVGTPFHSASGAGGQAGTVENPPPDPAKPRTGSTPAEITAALLWLCSDEAAATHGGRIPVFGRG
jgi:NAD(P)-dependent dehydrogenase (short-subunit alcohol dehydrogenase family)